MSAISFIFRRAIKIFSINLILGILNVATLVSLFIIAVEFNISAMQSLKYIFQFLTLFLITSAIILCMNSEFVRKIRDICILRAIGFQKYFIWFFFLTKSMAIGVVGSLIGILTGNAALFILFNKSPKISPILNVLVLGIISALIGCLFPLFKLSKLKIPEVLNR